MVFTKIIGNIRVIRLRGGDEATQRRNDSTSGRYLPTCSREKFPAIEICPDVAPRLFVDIFLLYIVVPYIILRGETSLESELFLEGVG